MVLLFQEYFQGQVKPVADVLAWDDTGDHLTKLFFTFFKLISTQYLFACFKMCWKVLKAQRCVCLFSKVTPCLCVGVRVQDGGQRSLGQRFPVIPAVALRDCEVTIRRVFISGRL